MTPLSAGRRGGVNPPEDPELGGTGRLRSHSERGRADRSCPAVQPHRDAFNDCPDCVAVPPLGFEPTLKGF